MWYRKINTDKENIQNIRNLMNLQLDFYKACENSCKKILQDEEIKKFNNKVFNIKFEKFLSEKFDDSKVYVSKNSSELDFYFYSKNRYCKLVDHPSVQYIKNDYYYFTNNRKFKFIHEENKRINIDQFLEAVKDSEQDLKARIQKLKFEIDNIENIIKEYHDILNIIDNYKQKYSYSTLKDYIKIEL